MNKKYLKAHQKISLPEFKYTIFLGLSGSKIKIMTDHHIAILHYVKLQHAPCNERTSSYQEISSLF